MEYIKVWKTWKTSSGMGYKVPQSNASCHEWPYKRQHTLRASVKVNNIANQFCNWFTVYFVNDRSISDAEIITFTWTWNFWDTSMLLWDDIFIKTAGLYEIGFDLTLTNTTAPILNIYKNWTTNSDIVRKIIWIPWKILWKSYVLLDAWDIVKFSIFLESGASWVTLLSNASKVSSSFYIIKV